MDPICTIINKCQQKHFSIADAAEEWLKITADVDAMLNVEYTQEMKNKIKQRGKMASNVYGLAANHLHPVYRGKRLTTMQNDLVRDFLFEVLDTNGLHSLNEYQQNEYLFKTLTEKKITEPGPFWGLVKEKHPELAACANRLLKIPASSAQLERVFSNWSWIHSTKRNKLTTTKSEKLIHCYYSLKLQDQSPTDEY